MPVKQAFQQEVIPIPITKITPLKVITAAYPAELNGQDLLHHIAVGVRRAQVHGVPPGGAPGCQPANRRGTGNLG
jgi:hypothetical protein